MPRLPESKSAIEFAVLLTCPLKRYRLQKYHCAWIGTIEARVRSAA